MQFILGYIREHFGPAAVDFDFVLAAGHFLGRDENLFTFFEGHGLAACHSKDQTTQVESYPRAGLAVCPPAISDGFPPETLLGARRPSMAGAV